MLGRVANNIYWLSRYIERASNTARFLEASYYLNLDLGINENEQWSPLIEINGDMEDFLKIYDYTNRENIIDYLVFNPNYPNSVASCLNSSKVLARGLREFLSIELFEAINEISNNINSLSDSYLNTNIFEICEQVKKSDMLISGIISKNIERGLGYNFWLLGEYLERADKTSRLLNVNYFYIFPEIEYIGTSIEDLQWSALLKSIDARDTYYRRYGIINPEEIIQMIIKDEDFPRSILFCLLSAHKCLLEITGNIPSEVNNLLTQLCYQIKYISKSEIINNGLHEFIDQLQIKMNGIDNSIYNHFCAIPQNKNIFNNLKTEIKNLRYRI